MEMAPVPDEARLCTSARHAGADADSYRVWIDGPVLRIDAGGHWDLAMAKSYTGEIARIVSEQRQAHPHLRAIVDRRYTPAFEPGVPEILLATYADILRSGDRIAMIVDSSLAKVDIRQRAGREETQAFLSISAARTWVLAYG